MCDVDRRQHNSNRPTENLVNHVKRLGNLPWTPVLILPEVTFKDHGWHVVWKITFHPQSNQQGARSNTLSSKSLTAVHHQERNVHRHKKEHTTKQMC